LLLRNAVDNAIRYTPEGGEVTVRVGHEDGYDILEVIDNGPGIPDAELDCVLEAFCRLPSNTQVGNGLGLAIARNNADQFEDFITFSSRPCGTGLNF